MNKVYSAAMIAVIAAVTMLLRFLPFAVFSKKRKVPAYILYLGDVLPYAIMGMLIVYCLRNVQITVAGDWIPTLVCVAAVAALQIWKRSTLLSILCGTGLYMFLVQVVFV